MATTRVHGRLVPRMTTGFDAISLDGGSTLRRLREQAQAERIEFEATQTDRLDRIVTAAVAAVVMAERTTPTPR